MNVHIRVGKTQRELRVNLRHWEQLQGEILIRSRYLLDGKDLSMDLVSVYPGDFFHRAFHVLRRSASWS